MQVEFRKLCVQCFLVIDSWNDEEVSKTLNSLAKIEFLAFFG